MLLQVFFLNSNSEKKNGLVFDEDKAHEIDAILVHPVFNAFYTTTGQYKWTHGKEMRDSERAAQHIYV